MAIRLKPVIGVLALAGIVGVAFGVLTDSPQNDGASNQQTVAAPDNGIAEAWRRDSERYAVTPQAFPEDDGVPVFRETLAELKAAFNKRLDEDTANNDKHIPHRATIKKCETKGGSVYCTFYDESFQLSVNGFKKLGIASGRFRYQSAVIFRLSKHKRVYSVLLLGGRSDPMNLFMFYSNVIDFARIWDSNRNAASDKEEFGMQLGLVRGTSTLSPGQETVLSKSYAMISCVPIPAEKGDPSGCAFTPP